MSNLLGAKFELIAEEVQELSLLIDKEVQRDLMKARVKQIATYIQKAVDGQTMGAFFAPLVVSKRTDGNMYILDGQHRWEGFQLAITQLVSSADKLARQLQNNQIEDDERVSVQEQLNETKIILNAVRTAKLPVMVYLGLNKDLERQLFHDLNNLAKKAPLSLALTFDSSDPYVRVAKEAITVVEGLSDLIEDGRSAKKLGDGKLFLFSTIHKAIVKLLGTAYFKNVNFQDVYDDAFEKAGKFLQVVMDSLPEDKLDSKYLYTDAKVLQGMGEFVRQMDAIKYVDGVTTLREALKAVSFENTNRQFAMAGNATVDSNGKISFKGTGSGVTAVVKTLNNYSLRLDAEGVEVTEAYSQNIDDKIDASEVETPEEDAVADSVVEASEGTTTESESEEFIPDEGSASQEEPKSQVSPQEIENFFK